VSANPSPPPAGNVHGAVNDVRSRKLRGSLRVVDGSNHVRAAKEFAATIVVV